MFLNIITEFMHVLRAIRVINVNDSFNSEFPEKSIFCILENISWGKEYLTYLAYIEIFCKF